MRNIRKILAVLDPTVIDQPAMQRAAWLAKKTGAELELLTCQYNDYMNGDGFFDSPFLEKARKEAMTRQYLHLEELAGPLRSDGISVTSAAIWDHPLYEGIVRHAMQSGADLVVKDTHHHSAVARVFLTNTDWNLIRTCPMPLWLVKPGEFSGSEPVSIVSAIDPMNRHDRPAVLDDDILTLSQMLADELGGKVHAVHTYDSSSAIASESVSAYMPIAMPLDDIENQMREHHRKRFLEITETHGIADDDAHLISGLTHEQLPVFAEEVGATVVVMGAIARNRWKRIFIGSTAERTLEHLPCDLLVVKPDWFETPVDAESHEAA